MEESLPKLNKVNLPNRIKLDVGGTIFATSKTTLLTGEENYFTSMFSGRFEIHPEEDGSYFIDRDPSVFQIVLNFMRGNPPKLSSLPPSQIEQLRDDALFYQLDGLVTYIDEYSPMESTILRDRRDLVKILEKWTGRRWKIQYRGSRDGFSADQYYIRCTGKGPTLFIAQDVGGFVFGGFRSVPLRGDNKETLDPISFIFTLINPGNVPPTPFYENGVGVSDLRCCGPCFGRTRDPYFQYELTTEGDCNLHEKNLFFFKYSYHAFPYDENLFTGNKYWRAKEVEVFVEA